MGGRCTEQCLLAICPFLRHSQFGCFIFSFVVTFFLCGLVANISIFPMLKIFHDLSICVSCICLELENESVHVRREVYYMHVSGKISKKCPPAQDREPAARQRGGQLDDSVREQNMKQKWTSQKESSKIRMELVEGSGGNLCIQRIECVLLVE